MRRDSRVLVSWAVLLAAAAALLLLGAGATYLTLRSNPAPPADVDPPAASNGGAASPVTTGGGGASPTAPLPDVVVTLGEEAVERAGITVSLVGTAAEAGGLRLPGVVEPDGYKQVAVTPLVSGRITRVLVELGARVRKGQTMALVFSPELSDAQTRYVSARAALDAHERELQRTEKLVAIGAASRQDLERLHAEHAAQTAAVQSARSRLELLGVPSGAIDRTTPGTVDASTSVLAPIAGVVTERLANAGLNVDTSAKLFTVVDLSDVWVVADLYEKDFSRVRVGSPATVTTSAYPSLALHGRVDYIDPQVSPETRTAKVRVAVPNAGERLRLGMYADVAIAGDANPGVSIPRSAVQHVGDRSVVYLANPTQRGTFVEREVRLGEASGDRVAVLSGLQPEDAVVTQGSFFVRAERERLGLRAAASAAPAPEVQTARVVVGETGYEPDRITLRAGQPARITFVRTTDKTCGTLVLFPSLKIERPLPLNEPVVVEFTPTEPGDIAFMCGMAMMRGTIVAQ